MSAIIGKARAWFGGRTVREQRMLGVMVLVIALCAIWLLIIQPLWAWKAEAAERRVQVETDLAYVQAQVGAVPKQVATSADGPAIEPLAVQAAQTAGLTIVTGMDQSGSFGFTAANVSSAALFGWLAELKTRHGIEAVRLDIVENADATLTAEGALARTQ
ncbi:type II secretion system protein GspM [Brevundimonas sp.]